MRVRSTFSVVWNSYIWLVIVVDKRGVPFRREKSFFLLFIGIIIVGKHKKGWDHTIRRSLSLSPLVLLKLFIVNWIAKSWNIKQTHRMHDGWNKTTNKEFQMPSVTTQRNTIFIFNAYFESMPTSFAHLHL